MPDSTSVPQQPPRLLRQPFYFLRHGQTDWNLERRGQGRTDIPLNATGERQAEDAKALLQHCDITSICCSPLSRARRTAEIVNQVLQKPIHVIDDLQEAGFGECEGVVAGDWFTDWFNGFTPKGAEPYEAFLLRALSGVNQALAHPGPVLIVAHGGIYWSIQRFANLPEGRVVPNCQPIHQEPPLDPSDDVWHATLLQNEAD